MTRECLPLALRWLVRRLSERDRDHECQRGDGDPEQCHECSPRCSDPEVGWRSSSRRSPSTDRVGCPSVNDLCPVFRHATGGGKEREVVNYDSYTAFSCVSEG